MPTVIRDFSYDESRNELTVRLVSGKVYVYSLVPASVAAAFSDAPAKGVYFNANIRDHFAYRLIAGEPVKDGATPVSLLDALKASREGDGS